MEELLWDLFKNTGDIKYFMMLKRLKDEDDLK